MSLKSDILRLNLELALSSNEDAFESHINSELIKNDYKVKETFDHFSNLKLRQKKIMNQYDLPKSAHNISAPSNDHLNSHYYQQQYNSFVDELSHIAQTQHRNAITGTKYSTNLHGFNRMGAKQFFIRSVIDLNPDINVTYTYNTGIGKHTENGEKPIIPIKILETAKNMFGNNDLFRIPPKNLGTIEHKHESANFASSSPRKQLNDIVFGKFDYEELLDQHV